MERSQKYNNFIVSRLSKADGFDYGVESIAGIGSTYGYALRRHDFSTAAKLIGHFLTLDMDRHEFGNMLRAILLKKDKNTEEIVDCVEEWCLANL